MASRKLVRPSRVTTSSDTPLSSGTFSVSGTKAGRVSVSPRPKRRAVSCAKPVAPILGIDKPPVASTSDCEVNAPWSVATVKWSALSMPVMRCATFTSTPAAAHSASSMATICRAEPSQKSWPSVFSCQAMRCLPTRAMKSCWV